MGDLGKHFEVDYAKARAKKQAIFQGQFYRITILTDLLVKIVRRCINKEYITYEQLFFLTESDMWLIIEYFCIDDKILNEMYQTFRTIKEIPIIDVGHDLKLRYVNPLVNGRRYY